jgi:hypothetical protein
MGTQRHVTAPARLAVLGTLLVSACVGSTGSPAANHEDVTNLGGKVLNWTGGTVRSFQIGAVAFLYVDLTAAA